MADDMNFEDEDVIFENSPLEKYLKDAGIVDFEPECVRKQNESTISNQVDYTECGETLRKSGLISLINNPILSLVNRLFSLDDIDKKLTLRKEYISTVFSSGIISEDDMVFLQQFDPELFDLPEISDVSLKPHNFLRTLHTHVLSKCDGCYGNVFAVVVLFLAIILSTHYYEYFSGIAMAVMALVFIFMCCYLWKRQKLSTAHRQNLKVLTNYVNDLKSFLTIFRKSILLIQELELVSKGYTFVGLGLQMRSQENKESGNYQSDVYPMLRKCLLENGMNLLKPSCSFLKNIVLSNPLASEVNSVFTYISTNPLTEFGLDDYSENEKLSLQYLKILLSVIASQQSELLSRYLLCLSQKAKDQTKYCSFTLKELEIVHQGFHNQWSLTYTVLTSLKLSYHVHKSSLTFTGQQDLKLGTTHKAVQRHVQSKWSRYYTAIHSLELHLKACITRTQAVTDFLVSEMQAEKDGLADKETHVQKATATDDSKVFKEKEFIIEGRQEDGTICKLESANSSLKMELDSTISCLEECVNSLKIIHGADEINIQEGELESSDDTEVENLPTNSTDCPNEERQEIIGDCVFEAYTDILDEDDIHSPLLTREELEKEARSREESKHLLVELKNVLLSKTKDPLITEAGFVEPIKKQSMQRDLLESSSLEDVDAKTKVDDKSENTENQESKDFKVPKTVMVPQLPKVHQFRSDGSTEIIAPFPSKAFSFAIQAAALSRGPIVEESYGSSNSSDSSDTE